jgi:hypothetical protein
MDFGLEGKRTMDGASDFAMNREKMRIAIAEECGTAKYITNEMAKDAGDPNLAGEMFWCGVPDYVNDANAMLGAACLLAGAGWRCSANMGTDGTWECFFTKNTDYLSTIPGEGDHYGAASCLSMALAEAFLRVVGRWKEDES